MSAPAPVIIVGGGIAGLSAALAALLATGQEFFFQSFYFCRRFLGVVFFI